MDAQPINSSDKVVQSPTRKIDNPYLSPLNTFSDSERNDFSSPNDREPTPPPEHDELADICYCSCLRPVVGVIGHGGFVASVYNLASATLGAGIVTVPGGFHDSGIIVSIILLAVVCACTIYSLRVLVETKEMTGMRSYEELARSLLGRGWDYLTAFLMFVFCWGVCIGYVISVGDIFVAMFQKEGEPEYPRSGLKVRLLTALVWFVGMLPPSLPKQINSLRYMSFVGVTSIIFFVICVIIHFSQNSNRTPIKNLRLASSGMSAVRGLNLFIFSFICQVNVFEIYEEMHQRTVSKMTRDSAISMILVAVLNFVSGFFGYCDFGEGVEGSLLLMYRPASSALFMIAYIGICIKVCVGFAICIQPSRDAIYYTLGWGKTSDVKTWVNLLISAALAVTAFICGLFIPNIATVFSFLGGICGGVLGFLLPAYFYLYTGGFTLKKMGTKKFVFNSICCIALLVGGVVAVVFGTAVSIHDVVAPE
ncbi:unnamed protein product [Phytomonas sp. EM1]|nr:unnamed protein product [Phytomonas sp. EM1]|eukprot:CCW60380.1 unnamed protein product [Phytomonas sp. isolate EM1]